MIKKSITNKLFFQIGILILSFSVMLILANSLLVKPIYLNSLEKTMIAALHQLKLLDYSADDELWREFVREVNLENELDIIIEEENIIRYSSSIEVGLHDMQGNQVTGDNASTIDKQEEEGHLIDEANKVINVYRTIEEWEEIEEGFYIGTLMDRRHNREVMVGRTQLSEDVSFYVSAPLDPINNQIQRSNTLLLICTIIFLCIAMLFAYRLSTQFTKPIKDIQRQVNRLTKLDFTNNLYLETGDELEVLGEDVNQLSYKLEEALDTLKEQNNQLEKEVLSQRNLLSNVSHELRTPLSLIKGYADEVKAGFITDAEQQKLIIEYISEEATKMNRLIKEILNLSHLESGRMALENSNYNVKKSISGFLEKYDGFVTKNKLNISWDLQEGAMGYYDEVRFEQVLANYIGNASKYCDKERVIKIYTETKESAIRIYVYNSGEAISEEIIDYIWEGFYKADQARSMDNESFGLGLSIVKAIQELAGQKYGVFNDTKGVVFWFDVLKSSNAE